MLNRWSNPLAQSSTGAAHRRRGQPCQDASLVATVTGHGSERLTLLAVADGHGAAAYPHSAVGSALACQAAVQAVAETLAAADGPAAGGLGTGGQGTGGLKGEPERRQRWLEHDLPAAIRRHWLAGVRHHWEGQPGQAALPFEPRPYGTTLGLVLLAPGWWGHTGLGDWDLVRIEGGRAQLLSEEARDSTVGEATGSLSQGEGTGPAGFRAAWWPLDPSTAPFALVLATDGIRKSCASDGDFLALATWLATEMAPSALATSLERISAEGCGDDGSVAIAHWGRPSEDPPGAQPAETPVEPPASPGSAVAIPQASQAVNAGWVARLPLGGLERRRALLLALLGGLVVAGAGALPALQRAFHPASMTGGDQDLVAEEARRLCGTMGLANAELRNRRSQFEGLRAGRLQRNTLLSQAQQDPLGALIAASFPTPGKPPSQGFPIQGIGTCPELEGSLRSLWANPMPQPAQTPASSPVAPRP